MEELMWNHIIYLPRGTFYEQHCSFPSCPFLFSSAQEGDISCLTRGTKVFIDFARIDVKRCPSRIHYYYYYCYTSFRLYHCEICNRVVPAPPISHLKRHQNWLNFILCVGWTGKLLLLSIQFIWTYTDCAKQYTKHARVMQWYKIAR